MAGINLNTAMVLRAMNANVAAVSGAQLYIYEAGTTTPVTTYSDEALTTANSHPIIADASGAWGDVYLSPQSVKVDVQSSVGVSLPGYPVDDIRVGDLTDMLASDALVTVGTTSRALDAKLGDVLHAKDYGVVADGSTDDTTALQAAIDALSAYDTLIIPPNVKTNGVITVTTSDVTLDIQGLWAMGDTGTSATLVSTATGKVGLHFKEADRVKITGTPRFVGQGTVGTTALACVVFDNCDDVQCPATFYARQAAAGRFVIACDRGSFGNIVADAMDGQQVFDSGTAGSAEVVIGCQYSVFGDCVSYNGYKPARYLSVDTDMRQNLKCSFGATIFEADSGSSEAIALALRNAKNCTFGPVIATDGAFSIHLWSGSGDTTENDGNYIEAFVGSGAATSASADGIIYQFTSGSAIGTNTIGSVNGTAAGEWGVHVTSGTLKIGSAVLTGAATRLVAVYASTGTAKLHFENLTITGNSGTVAPVTYGLGGYLSIGHLDLATGPEETTATAGVIYNGSLGSGSTGYDIGTIRYRQNGSTENYQYVLFDGTNGFETGRIGHIDGTGSTAQARFAAGAWSVNRGRYLSSAAPTAGTYTVGALVWNDAVSAGGSPAWSCTTAGTPGTWKAHANVAA